MFEELELFTTSGFLHIKVWRIFYKWPWFVCSYAYTYRDVKNPSNPKKNKDDQNDNITIFKNYSAKFLLFHEVLNRVNVLETCEEKKNRCGSNNPLHECGFMPGIVRRTTGLQVVTCSVGLKMIFGVTTKKHPFHNMSRTS